MKIADTVTPTDYTVLTTAGENDVHLRVVDSGRRGQNALAQLPRAEFIRAIETELDGTWINHADLPKVTADGDALRAGEQYWLDTSRPDFLRREALELLALARHLEANPPVDEAAVDALAKVLSNEGDGGIWEYLDARNSRIVALRLVQAGVRAPEETNKDGAA